MAMQLKTVTVDNKVYAEILDGKPVYTHDDGKDVGMDVIGLSTRITALNAEAMGHRKAKETAEAALQAYNGLDAEAARKAIETVGNLDAKKLVDAGEVDKIKQAAIAAIEEKYKPIVNEHAQLKADIFGERLGNRFNNSKFIAEKMAVPADVARAVFGTHFRDEGGQLVGYYNDGNKVYSRENPGTPAVFDEAMSMLVDAYAHKESILKGTGGGSGSNGSRGGGAAGPKEIKRADFDKMPIHERDSAIKDGNKIVD